MEKGRPLLRWAVILLVCGAVSFLGIEARGEKEPAQAAELGRPDLVKIDTLAAFQKLELPPVTFLHDKHTEALLKEKRDCQTCHFVEDGKLSLAFKRKKATQPGEIKDIYHANCIGCHMERAAAGKETGPPDGLCRACHNPEPAVAAARLDAGFNQVLHFRHTDSKLIPPPTGQDNCGSCHHEYDQKTKKIFYAKGKEGTCRYCHLEKPQEGVKSLEQAAHLQCVLCHLDLASKGNKDHGPFVCADCHGTAGQIEIAKKNQEKLASLPNHEVPRLKRGQPDAALITHDPKLEAGKPAKPILMDPVAFDHLGHEKYSDTCRVCHHASMEQCEKCHTLEGSKEGKFFNFEQAMHMLSSRESCLGCHREQQAGVKCAGCHNRLSKKPRVDDATCRQCHLTPAGPALQGAGLPGQFSGMTPPQKAAAAALMLKTRNLHPGTYPLEDIAEKVEIKDLADRYQPCEFNHRQHVVELLKGIKGNTLAEYFHNDPGTICQACHHYSPPAKEPPRCGNCHGGENLLAREFNRPALLAALHQQCMECHTDMKEKPAATACTECHQEKQK